jgi:beta-galactosidase
MYPYGADYYPEHWPEERWIEDARLMAEAGFNVVRMAEFAWSRLEPQEGVFDFAWLDSAIDILATQGIRTVLGTPTASPPPWVMATDRTMYRVLPNGEPLSFGNRREYCPNHPIYWQHTRRIVERMAAHYAGNPHVIAWQIDNEFGDPCYCPVCRRNFQVWLRDRDETLDNLNEKWGTIFWSHVYTDWNQIPVPYEHISQNPGLALDFKRFASDSYVRYQQMQIEIIRKHSEQPITHNFMGFGYNKINYYDLAEPLDFVSWDNYVRVFWDMKAEIDPSQAALSHDTMRGLKKGNFWVMEQQAGPTGWEIIGDTPKPGELRLWAYQAIAHGADGLVYFRWRTCRFGNEEYWHGVLDHHGIPGRRYHEIAQVGEELGRIGKKILDSEALSLVAIMQSYDTRFGFQTQPNNPQFKYESHLHDFYQGLFNLHVGVDIVSEKDDLTGYRVVFVPSMYLLSERTAATLAEFARSGGIVIFTPRTGVKDEANAVVNMKLPGLAAEMCGVEVEEYKSMPPDDQETIHMGLPGHEGNFDVALWAEVLEPKGAEVIARFQRDEYASMPAITRNNFGDGQVIYIGVFSSEVRFYEHIAHWALTEARLTPPIEASLGVEVTERWQGENRLLFLLNHNNLPHPIRLTGELTELISGKRVSGTVQLGARDVMILSTERLETNGDVPSG